MINKRVLFPYFLDFNELKSYLSVDGRKFFYIHYNVEEIIQCGINPKNREKSSDEEKVQNSQTPK